MKPVIKAATAIYNAGGFNYVYDTIHQASKALGYLHYCVGDYILKSGKSYLPEAPYQYWDEIVNWFKDTYKLTLIPFDAETDCAVNSLKLEGSAKFTKDVLTMFNAHRDYILDCQNKEEIERADALGLIVRDAWILHQFDGYGMFENRSMYSRQYELLIRLRDLLVASRSW